MKKLVFILVLSSVFGVAFAETAAPINSLTSTVAQSGVRKPTSNVDAFWDNLNWSEMSADEQKLWTTLGWSEKSWQGDKSLAPVSNDLDWIKLNPNEQAAASALGYDSKTWDAQ
jgi:hypothetical protein